MRFSRLAALCALLLSAAAAPAVEPHALGPCDDALLGKTGVSALERVRAFVGLLREGRLNEAQAELNEELERVRQEIELLPPEERDRLRNEWAGDYTGNVISTPLRPLIATSDALAFPVGATLVDIGSGHGNPDIVWGALNPGLKILGFDLAGPKVDGAMRIAERYGLRNVRFVKQDLGAPDFKLPIADYYFMYNPVSPRLTRLLAAQIRENCARHPAKVIIYGLKPSLLSRETEWTSALFKEEGFEMLPNPALRELRVGIFELSLRPR